MVMSEMFDNRVVECVQDFMTQGDISDDSDVVVFELSTPGGTVLKCYSRKSLIDLFHRMASRMASRKELPDSRLPVEPGDVVRIQGDVERIRRAHDILRTNLSVCEEELDRCEDELKYTAGEYEREMRNNGALKEALTKVEKTLKRAERDKQTLGERVQQAKRAEELAKLPEELAKLQCLHSEERKAWRPT